MNTLTENFKGTVCFLILLTNTLLLATLMIPLGVIKFLIPIKSLRISFTKMIINIGEIWISVNSVWVLKILNPNIQIQGFESLNKNSNEVPINLEIRKIMKLAREEKILKMENKFRKSLNLDPFVTYDEFVNSDPEEISELREGIVLKEAAEILVDSIQLKEAPSRLSFGILNQ